MVPSLPAVALRAQPPRHRFFQHCPLYMSRSRLIRSQEREQRRPYVEMWGSHYHSPLHAVSLGTSSLGQRHESLKQHPEERNGGLLGWSTMGRSLFPQAG